MKKLNFWDLGHILVIISSSLMLLFGRLTKPSEFGVFFLILVMGILNILRRRVNKKIYNSISIILILLTIVCIASLFLKW